ncbi:MAG: hypothetical protein HC802_04325, partial [Caldilineaceae bacterium]|nr:hypothetical protein [Caldilineaceae bacterium]
MLVGLASALVLTVLRCPPSDESRVRNALFGLMLFALIYWLGMAVSAKQFDRYFLPAALALNVIAAIGWIGLGGAVARRFQRPVAGYALPMLALLLIGASSLRHFPYYLTYYNPLVGGAKTAPQTLMVGWGEGLDEAARRLNQQPDAENLRAVSWYETGPFSYFFKGETGRWSYLAPLAWLDTDFVVLYVNQWQRDIPDAKILAHFAQHEPAHIVVEDGLELARIYDLRDTLLPDFVEIDDDRVADFGAQIRLAAIELEGREAHAGDSLPVTFYLQAIAPIGQNVNQLVQLIGPDGDLLW